MKAITNQYPFPFTEKEAERSGVPYSSEANKNALFPSRLRELRKEKGVSQDVLSKVLVVSKSTVGLWETGDTLPDAKSLFKLASYYGVSADWLVGLTDNPKPHLSLEEQVGLTQKAYVGLQKIDRKHKDALVALLESFS